MITSMQKSAFEFTVVTEERHNVTNGILEKTITTPPVTATTANINVNVLSTPISSPRLWLESLPNGAYTVIRCDYYYHTTKMESDNRRHDEGHWKIWGIDFHLQRLQQSFMALQVGMLHSTDNLVEDDFQEREIGYDVAKAYHDTIAICSALKCKKEIWHPLENESVANEDPTVIMLTILWYNDIEKNEIIVIAHATKSSASLTTTTTTVPWNIVLHTASTPPLMIHRQSYPQPLAKVSVWCQQRRPLESIYMPTSSSILRSDFRNDCDGLNDEQMPVTINEIILTQQEATTGHIQLLEGLTSNLFVVYPNQIIRTAGKGVLFGYVRHMLMELLSSPMRNNATMTPYTVDTSKPILMDDAHEWQEVFCTSSIRLIVPVERVYVPWDNSDRATDHTKASSSVKELWSRTNMIEPRKKPIWKDLRTILSESMLLETDNL